MQHTATRSEVSPSPAKEAGRASSGNASLNEQRAGAISTDAAGPPEGQPPQSGSVREVVSSFGTSLVIHLMALLILACFAVQTKNVESLLTIIGPAGANDPTDGADVDFVAPIEMPATDQLPDLNLNPAVEAKKTAGVELRINELAPAVPLQDPPLLSPLTAIRMATDFSGRTEGGRAARARAGGGNEASEAGVEMGLQWLKKHQQPDGSWSFVHFVNAQCQQECSRPGLISDCKTGATAMALLCFLGAGHTHLQGSYRKQVQDGLEFLINHMEVTSNGGDLRGEGSYHSMYAHGLAAIALCEAYGMTTLQSDNATTSARESATTKVKESTATKEKGKPARAEKGRGKKPHPFRGPFAVRLKDAAQYAVDFIEYAQDPTGGGWRYAPRERGDTSVVGWQLMALHSAKISELRTHPITFERTGYFLNHVQADGGSQYGYLTSEPGRPGTTAIGLLCRMYLGWPRDEKALQQGVAYLSSFGPSENDMYYNYYATQVLHHWGGEKWTKWNSVMRDFLVDSQVGTTHAAGSWNINDVHGSQGGRLYVTCLAIMTLEVYYRHLPLYHRDLLENP